VKNAADDLRQTVDSAYSRLIAIDDDKAGMSRSAGKWSPREVIGHLIDSAINNHGRLVRARLGDDMVFPGYEQDAWVKVQGYSDRHWMELVELWRMLNSHIAHAIETIPPSDATRMRRHHNLDQIAWRTVPADQPVTLEYFVRDYVAHMKHHLSQIP